MNKFLLIFALLIASCDTTDPLQVETVALQISDANPIQFWPADCETYNEKEVCGVHPKCWCHPWQCDDEIPIQFTDTDDADYFLRVIDNNENTIDDIPFDKYASGDVFVYSNTIVPSEVSDDLCNTQARFEIVKQSSSGGVTIASEGSYDSFWTNDAVSGTVPWTISPTDFFVVFGSIPFPGTLSNVAKRNMTGGGVSVTINHYIVISTGIGQRHYTITYNFYSFGLLVGTISKEYTAEDSTSFSIVEDVSGPVGVFDEIQVTIEHPEESFSEFDLVTAVMTSVFTDETVLKSDCIDIADVQKCTTGIEYSNNRNLAGLIYENTSPDIVFNIRVPAIFFHEEFPEEDEAMDLTTGLVKTSGTLKAQRLFETDYMPYYMHRKLMLIFKHQTINIESLAWIKEEKYEIQAGDRRWPVKKAKCLLNENYIQRAVL